MPRLEPLAELIGMCGSRSFLDICRSSPTGRHRRYCSQSSVPKTEWFSRSAKVEIKLRSRLVVTIQQVNQTRINELENNQKETRFVSLVSNKTKYK